MGFPKFLFLFFNGFIAEEYSSTSYMIYIYMYVYMCSTVTQKKIFELFEIQTISTPHTDSHMYFTTRSLHFVEGAYLLSATTNVDLPMIMLTFPTMNLKWNKAHKDEVCRIKKGTARLKTAYLNIVYSSFQSNSKISQHQSSRCGMQ